MPDVLTLKEVERLINGTRERRYQTFILCCFSMGLRLGEALALRVGDIDSERMKVRIRQAKGKKDRLKWLSTPAPILGETPESGAYLSTRKKRGYAALRQ